MVPFAHKLKLSGSTWSNYEKGKRPIPGDVLLRLKEYTHVNVEWLLTGNGDRILKEQTTTGPAAVAESREVYRAGSACFEQVLAEAMRLAVEKGITLTVTIAPRAKQKEGGQP